MAEQQQSGWQAVAHKLPAGWEPVPVSDDDLERIEAWVMSCPLWIGEEGQAILRLCAALRQARQERDQMLAEREEARNHLDMIHGCLLFDGGRCPDEGTSADP